MMYFAIIETDDGLSIVEYSRDKDAADVAEANGGVLIDAGPFASYEDAYDALLDLEPDEEDRERM